MTGRFLRRVARLAAPVALYGVLLAAAGCGRAERASGRRPPGALALPVTVLADSGRTVSLRLPPPAARVWLERVRLSPPRAPAPPLPAAPPDTLYPEPAAPAAPAGEGLKPPILRAPARLRVPARVARGTAVELDIRVDERGAVTDVAWSGGSADSALVGVARECALGMRFFPAVKGGVPVAVWCRQSFEFGKR
jgi:hypothetical protein